MPPPEDIAALEKQMFWRGLAFGNFQPFRRRIDMRLSLHLKL